MTDVSCPARPGSASRWDHRLRLLGVVLLMLLGAAWAGARWLLGPEVVAYPVVRTDFVRTVVATGHVETPYRVEIGSQITGTVQEVLVEEGQAVTRGQPLIRLETSELTGALDQARGLVAEAQARERQLRELTLPAARQALKQAQAALANAEAAHRRTADLARNGYATQAVLDEAVKALDIARAQVRTAQLQVYTASPGGSDHVLAQTQLRQAEAALATARSRLAYADILAPRDGVLITRSVERGAVVQPGRALLVLAPSGDMQLVLQIDEKNLGLLRLGETALASADAFPDQRFPARLTYINPAVDITRASVEVKLTVTEPPPYLRQDMTVSVDIETERRPGALVVPARTVHEPAGPAPWVLVYRDGRVHEQRVKVGLRGGESVEILDGLAAGEQVVPVGAGVRAGQRIRPVAP
jgi:HlyD family secretion protein